MESLSHDSYKPRNIINAPDIKAAILQRSQQRNDSDAIQRWLINHFYRWTVGNFPEVTSVSSVVDYATCFGTDATIPDWLASQLSGDTIFFYLNPQHPQLLAKERDLVEFLVCQATTRLANKLQRINCFTALAMRKAEHKKMQQRQKQGWHPASLSALKPVMAVGCGEIVEFDSLSPDLRREMAYESWHMQHCVGQFQNKKALTGGYGDYYARRIEQGEMRLFSLRDSNNIPHVTVSLKVNKGMLSIDQIKGKQNRHPIKKYAKDVLYILRHLGPQPERHVDCEGMGIVYEETPDRQGWKFITDVEDQHFLQSVLHNNFHLLKHFPSPPVALQWLLLHSAPDKLHYLQSIDPTVATAAEMLFPQQEWHPALAGKNIDSAPFCIEDVTLHTTRYLAAGEGE